MCIRDRLCIRAYCISSCIFSVRIYHPVHISYPQNFCHILNSKLSKLCFVSYFSVSPQYPSLALRPKCPNWSVAYMYGLTYHHFRFSWHFRLFCEIVIHSIVHHGFSNFNFHFTWNPRSSIAMPLYGRHTHANYENLSVPVCTRSQQFNPLHYNNNNVLLLQLHFIGCYRKNKYFSLWESFSKTRIVDVLFTIILLQDLQ